MIHPSYVELMKVVNNNVEFGEGKLKIIPDTEDEE